MTLLSDTNPAAVRTSSRSPEVATWIVAPHLWRELEALLELAKIPAQIMSLYHLHDVNFEKVVSIEIIVLHKDRQVVEQFLTRKGAFAEAI